LVRRIVGELTDEQETQARTLQGTSLKPFVAAGLDETIDSTLVVETAARRELQRLLERGRGASIGIAGPRGVGKSTLVRWAAGLPELNGRKVVSVVVHAPVQYEPRDFILHVFQRLCEETLVAAQRPDLIDDVSPRDHLLREKEGPLVHVAKVFADFSRWLVVGGVICLYVGIALLFQRALSEAAARDATHLKEWLRAHPTDPANGAKPHTTKPSVGDYVNAAGFTPSGFLTAGCAALILFAVARNSRRRQAQRERFQEQSEFGSASVSVSKYPAVKAATECLQNIRFQRSWSVGVTGALELPLGLKVGNSSVSNAQRHVLTLPQLVSQYRSFLGTVTAGIDGKQPCTVIVGIDEMDRLENDEKASRFLNEVKALFGVQNCFYVVTVSEGAMSAFERRGLPFRDEFDSAFDTIIWANYLTFNEARALLAGRVIGLPLAFAGLCYALSGGLPRDLVRAARELRDITKEAATLPDSASALVVAELRGKSRATVITARRNANVTAAYSLVAVAHRTETAVRDITRSARIGLATGEFQALVRALRDWNVHLVDGDDDRPVELERLSRDLANFVEFCELLQRFFTSRGSSTFTWLSSDKKLLADVEDLAYVRSSLIHGAERAAELLRKFRTSFFLQAARERPALEAATPRAPVKALPFRRFKRRASATPRKRRALIGHAFSTGKGAPGPSTARRRLFFAGARDSRPRRRGLSCKAF
jgi:hypothetical protein